VREIIIIAAIFLVMLPLKKVLAVEPFRCQQVMEESFFKVYRCENDEVICYFKETDVMIADKMKCTYKNSPKSQPKSEESSGKGVDSNVESPCEDGSSNVCYLGETL